MAEQKRTDYRAVLLIEDADGNRQAYEIGDAPGVPFTFSRDINGRISVSGLFLGGAIWKDPMPEQADAVMQAIARGTNARTNRVNWSTER